jgi:Tetratricopeptide repeat
MYRVGFPYLGEEFAVNARLPGPGQRWFRHGAVLAGYVCLAALAIALGPADSREPAGAVAAAAPVVLFPAWCGVARFMARVFVLPSWGFETVEAPGLRAALLSAGLRRVIVVTSSIDPVKRRTAWALRSGRTGIIALSADLKDPDAATADRTLFLTAHEAAHVVRNDTMTSILLSVGRLCLLLVVALTAPASLWLLLPLVALPVAVRWHTELACDRIAVEVAGPVPARAYVDYYGQALERARSRPLPRHLIWWTWDKFTYPPWRIRRNAIAALIAKQEASPCARLASWIATGNDAAAARDQYSLRLPIRERALGPDHPDTLIMRHELARSTADAGDPAAARDQFTALLPICERVLGPDHPGTLATGHSLAYWTGKAGDPAAARDQFTALLPIRERVLGPDHPATLASGRNLAYWTGKAAAAKPRQLSSSDDPVTSVE